MLSFWQWAVSCGLWALLLTARGSLLIAKSRDVTPVASHKKDAIFPKSYSNASQKKQIRIPQKMRRVNVCLFWITLTRLYIIGRNESRPYKTHSSLPLIS